MYNRQPNLTICFLLLYMFLIQNLHIMLQMHYYIPSGFPETSPLRRLLPLRLPKMPYGYFACGLTQAVFEPHLFQPFRDLISGKICPVDFLMSGFSRALHRFMVIFPANRSRYQICGLPGINIWIARARSIFHPTLPMHCSMWHLPDNTDSFVHVNF